MFNYLLQIDMVLTPAEVQERDWLRVKVGNSTITDEERKRLKELDKGEDKEEVAAATTTSEYNDDTDNSKSKAAAKKDEEVTSKRIGHTKR